MTRILMIGHSHLQPVALAFGKFGSSLLNEYRFLQLINADFADVNRTGGLSDALRNEIGSKPFDVVVSMVGGNEHSVLGLLNHSQKFDFVMPDAVNLPIQADAEILPFSVVRRRLKERMAVCLRLLRELREFVPGEIMHVEPTPPNPSEEHIRKYPGVFAAKIEELGVAPNCFRYKLWRLNSNLLRETCDEIGVRFVAGPAAMRDENGMLAREAWNPDPTHGNSAYGRHVLLEIESAVARQNLEMAVLDAANGE